MIGVSRTCAFAGLCNITNLRRKSIFVNLKISLLQVMLRTFPV